MSEGRKITILGMGPSSIERRLDILRYCEGTEIWTLNNAYLTFGHIQDKVTRWFELHSFDYLRTWDAGVQDHFRHLDKIGCEVITSEQLPVIRNQVVVNWMDVFTHFAFAGGQASNYFLGSPSLMLAWALWEHDHGKPVSMIQSFGIDTSDPTHKQQRQSWAYWCAHAHARKIVLSGTMVDFFSEPEIDKGLQGLRERIGDELMKQNAGKQEV